jgi:hypothetical protein
VTAEMRREWVCVDCAMRVYNACGDPIPEPRGWADERCPHSRVERVKEADGFDAADELSVELGLSRRRKNNFNKSGAPPSGPTPEPAPLDSEAVECELRKTTDSDQEIARRLGVAEPHRVRNLRVELGIPTGQERRMAQLRANVERLVGEHPEWTNQQVADEIGESRTSVRGVRAALGLPAYRHGRRPVPPSTS